MLSHTLLKDAFTHTAYTISKDKKLLNPCQRSNFFVNPRLYVAIQKVVNISLKPFINSL